MRAHSGGEVEGPGKDPLPGAPAIHLGLSGSRKI